MTTKKEKTSLIQMLNTSIGNISGLFKTKKSDGKETEEIEIEEIVPSQEKEEGSFLLKEEEEEFEKDLSRISISMEDDAEEEKDEQTVETKSSIREETISTDEINRLKKIITLKDEIRQREREKEKEKEEINTLENIKTRAELEYERKRRKVLQQVIASLEKSLEESEIQKLELMKYCKLLIEQEQKNLSEKNKQ